MKKILLLILVLIFLYACPDNFSGDDGCKQYRYYFTLPVSFVPTDSIIHIGDTVTITSKFSNKLWNDKHTELFTFDSIDFKVHCQFIKVDTIIHLFDRFDFLNDFEVFSDSIYNLRKGKTIVVFDYHYDGNEYFLQFKFMPKHKGIYIFEFFSQRNAPSFDWDDAYILDEDGDCETNRWRPQLITNNGQSYSELLKYSPNEYYKERSGFYFSPERDGAHCFKVE